MSSCRCPSRQLMLTSPSTNSIVILSLTFYCGLPARSESVSIQCHSNNCRSLRLLPLKLVNLSWELIVHWKWSYFWSTSSTCYCAIICCLLTYFSILPSLGICQPADSKPVPKPGNRDGCGRKDIRRKMPCMAGLTLTLVCVAAEGLLVVIQWEVWVRVDQWLTKVVIKSRIRRVWRKCLFLFSGSSCFFQLFPLGCPLY